MHFVSVKTDVLKLLNDDKELKLQRSRNNGECTSTVPTDFGQPPSSPRGSVSADRRLRTV